MWTIEKSRRSRRAMTLIEITVTILIVAVMVAVILPNLGPMRNRGQLRTATRNLATLVRYARSEAIYKHHVVLLRLDMESHAYRLDLLTDGKPAAKRKGPDRDRVEELRYIPNRVYFDQVIFYQAVETREGKIVALEFLPDGTCTPASIVLADIRGRHMTVDIFGTTGAVEVYDGLPPEAAAGGGASG
jgi:Tfp pilus assembly protein FimT